MRLLSVLGSVAAFAPMVAAPSADAGERHIDVGVRGSIVAADGEPANDIPGAGLITHYSLNESWTVGAALDRSEFDFEQPAKVIGIMQDPVLEPIDALAEGTMISVWMERAITAPSRPTQLFVGIGAGAASIDVPDAAGARADGGRFDIRTEVDTEMIAFALAGARRNLGQRWYGEVAVRLEQHFADWRIIDRVSGAQGRVGDYRTWGVHVAVGYRFGAP